MWENQRIVNQFQYRLYINYNLDKMPTLLATDFEITEI